MSTRLAVDVCATTHDDVVAATFLDHVGDELGGDRRAVLVLLVLSCIGEQRDDGGDPLRAGDLARMDHNAQLDQGRVDRAAVVRAAAVDDVHVALPYRLHEPHGRLPNAVAGDDGLGQWHTNPAELF